MQCPDCGAYASEEDLFCGECGRPLAKEAPPPAPLSPEEAKDLPTVGIERPSPRPSPRVAAPVPERTRSSLLPVVLFAIMGILVLCLIVGGLIFWSVSRQSSKATPTPSGPAVGVLLYEDDFGDADSGWDVYDEDDTQASYVDGEYRLAVYQTDYMAWGNPDTDEEFTGFWAEVDARQVEGPLDNNFGLLVRYQPDNDAFYWFQISADGYYSFDLRQGSDWTSLVGWAESDAIRQGQDATNRLKVICQGSRFGLYVNDVFLAEVTDDALDSGDIGLAAGDFDEPGVVIHFDNLKVYALQE